MYNPLLSIITPSYNQSNFIEQNIRSVKQQTEDLNEEVEHIVVDGGSTDSTIDILEQYEDDYKLRWVSEPDNGQSHAINKGIKMARGEWLGWQNSDDYYLEGSFEALRNAIQSSRQIDVLYGDVLIVDEDGAVIDRRYMTKPSKFVQRYWSLFARNQATFFHRNCFKKLNGLNETLEYTMDAELFWQILNTDVDVTHVPRFLGAFRIQEDAKTAGKLSNDHIEERKKIYGEPWYEAVVPQRALQTAARGLKLWYLLTEQRWEPIKYNLVNSIQG
ncbi:glycosyltransferase family 2 protein [Halorubrum sp. GN11_10-6_MGM]|uniref:glycosyltransferase family 2 protein n=1 Tax=Halorubrum sp. GN11_10-6_MGM TaxID=2518112 RepID=UPI00130DD6D2|nr:glycosyltransferase family 2 protein [Halorubrum sp. GN11_10-6_MGM]